MGNRNKIVIGKNKFQKTFSINNNLNIHNMKLFNKKATPKDLMVYLGFASCQIAMLIALLVLKEGITLNIGSVTLITFIYLCFTLLTSYPLYMHLNEYK